MSAGRRPPPRPRRRKITLAGAVALSLLALVVGLLGGMALRGEGDGRMTTVTEPIRVVTVTPGR